MNSRTVQMDIWDTYNKIGTENWSSQAFLQLYSVVSIKRTGGNKQTGGENSPKIVKRTGWTFCQK